VQRTDLASGRARVVAHLPRALGHAAAVVLDGRVLLAGGRTGPDTVTDRMWWFSPSAGFTRAGRLPTGLADATPVAADTGTAYLVGGETPALTDRVVRLALR
jgi:N-acetylneuraminic acid mutarotase